MGYFVGRIATTLAQPILDRVLVCDTGIFAWRIVPVGTRLDHNKRYLAAAEIIPDDFDEAQERY